MKKRMGKEQRVEGSPQLDRRRRCLAKLWLG